MGGSGWVYVFLNPFFPLSFKWQGLHLINFARKTFLLCWLPTAGPRGQQHRGPARPGHPPTEICTSATILWGRRKGKGSAPSRATACITSSQRRSSGSGFSRVRRFAVGTVRMMLSVASSPQGPGFSWIRLFHSSWDVSPGKRDHGAWNSLSQIPHGKTCNLNPWRTPRSWPSLSPSPSFFCEVLVNVV